MSEIQSQEKSMEFFSFISEKDFPLPYFLLLVAIFFALILAVHIIKQRQSRIKLPKRFLMESDCLKEVVPVLRNLMLRESDEIKLDFSNVTELSQGAYMVLFAQAQKASLSGKRIMIYAKYIRNARVWNVLVSRKEYKGQHPLHYAEIQPISSESDNKLYMDDVDEYVNDLKRLGFTSYYQPFYDFLVELIGNAVEHGIRERDINWWMWKERDPKTKSFKYVFFEMGGGILDSYKESKIVPFFRFRNKRNFLLEVFDGKWGSTTQKPGRGRGLPQIKDIVEKGFVSDFILITNNVYLQYKNGEFITGKNPNFVGTYCSWSISKNNFITWKSTQLRLQQNLAINLEEDGEI